MTAAFLRVPGAHRPAFGGRDAQCSGKTAYVTPQAAQEVMRQRAKRRRHDRQGHGYFGSYKCPFCGAWHIGEADRNLP